MHVKTIAFPDLEADLTGDFAQAFGQALEQTGFAIITEHGISDWLLQSAYMQAQFLFAHPDWYLQRYRREQLRHQVGFTPLRIEHARDETTPDLKRFWQLQRPLPLGHPDRNRDSAVLDNVWPDKEVPHFRDVFQELFRRMDTLSVSLLEALDAYLDWEDCLPGMITGGPTIMRVLHYPPVDQDQLGLRSAPHEDINLITLLVAATESGLELKSRDHSWIAVRELPGSIVVNAGDMLQELTGHRLLSATHRVTNASNERYSIPLFAHPRSDTILNSTSGLTAGAYLQQRLREIRLA